MIKFPVNDVEVSCDEMDIKKAVDAGKVFLGQRFMIGDNAVTCDHIDGDKYIFSFDDVFKTTSHDGIFSVLKEVFETGMIDGMCILPYSICRFIDFVFAPSERQIFGTNRYGEKEDESVKQFDWFKRGDSVRVKGYKGQKNENWEFGETLPWWSCTVDSESSTDCCYVSYSGNAYDTSASHTHVGVPVFFQMTRNKR